MKHPIHIIILLLIISASNYSLFSDETYSNNKRGNYLYKNQQYKEALKIYDDAILLSPSDNRLKMNKGSTHYQLGEFDKAEEAYNAALSSDNKDQLADAHYNMGNIMFRQGAQMYQQGPQQAIEKFKSAYEHYVKSLELRPSDTDAKWNLQLAHQVMKQLEQQKQQQQNQQNNKDDKNKQDQQNKDQQQNQNQNKNDQNKDEQKEKNQQQQQEQDKKEDQEKKDQDKDQQQKQDQNQQDQKQQQPRQAEMKEQEDLKKEEAKRIIEMFADDADTLNKPMTKQKSAGMRQPTQDW